MVIYVRRGYGRVLAEEYKLRASDGWEQMEQQTEEGRSLVWHEREEQHTVPFLSLRWSELLLEQRQVLFLNMRTNFYTWQFKLCFASFQLLNRIIYMLHRQST